MRLVPDLAALAADLPAAMHCEGEHNGAACWGQLLRQASGWEYDGVGLILLAFAALQVWREPLAVVLRREIMDPIGSSPTWGWGSLPSRRSGSRTNAHDESLVAKPGSDRQISSWRLFFPRRVDKHGLPVAAWEGGPPTIHILQRTGQADIGCCIL